MKLILTAAIILVVMSAALAIYLEVGNRRFDASLPKPLNQHNDSSNKDDLVTNTTSESLDSSADESDVLLDSQTPTDIVTENINDEHDAIETTTDNSYNSELDLFEQYLEDEFDVSEDDIENDTFVQENTNQEDYLYHTSSA